MVFIDNIQQSYDYGPRPDITTLEGEVIEHNVYARTFRLLENDVVYAPERCTPT